MAFARQIIPGNFWWRLPEFFPGSLVVVQFEMRHLLTSQQFG
jgi:hypothetical protein